MIPSVGKQLYVPGKLFQAAEGFVVAAVAEAAQIGCEAMKFFGKGGQDRRKMHAA